MLGDSAALALALVAAWHAARPATSERSFGYRRAEILAALVNGVALAGDRGWGLHRGRPTPGQSPGDPRRLDARGRADRARRQRGRGGHPLARGRRSECPGRAPARLRGPRRVGRSRDRGARRAHHRLGPCRSRGRNGDRRADPRQLMVDRARFGLDPLEATPAGIDADEVGRRMASVEGVAEVHDLHIWTITSGFPNGSRPTSSCGGAMIATYDGEKSSSSSPRSSGSSTRRFRSSTSASGAGFRSSPCAAAPASAVSGELCAGCLQTPSRRARRGSPSRPGPAFWLFDLDLSSGQRPLPRGELGAFAPHALSLVGSCLPGRLGLPLLLGDRSRP